MYEIDDYPQVEVTPRTAKRLIELLDYVYSQARIEPPGVSRCKDESLLRDCQVLGMLLRVSYTRTTGRVL